MQYQPYSEFRDNDENVYLTIDSAQNKSKNNIKYFIRNKLNNYFDSKFAYGIQSSKNINGYLFEILLEYKQLQKLKFIHNKLSIAYGFIFTLPCYMFAKNYYNIKFLDSKVFFTGPFISPIYYQGDNITLSLKVILLLPVYLQFNNIVCDENNNNITNETILNNINSHSYKSEYGFTHFLIGFDIIKECFGLFLGVKITSHLKELGITHVFYHILDIFSKDLWVQNHACYSNNSVIFNSMSFCDENNNIIKTEIVTNKLLFTKLSFCNLSIVCNFTIN